MTKNMPMPALVLLIWVMDSNNDEALSIRPDTSSVKPFPMILADCSVICANSLLAILKASVNKPIKNEITPRISTTPAKVRTKSFAELCLFLALFHF